MQRPKGSAHASQFLDKAFQTNCEYGLGEEMTVAREEAGFEVRSIKIKQ